ncbi:Cytochrome P450 71D8 [Acorus gramineus]|uniref:Cytochrome P450 71D8 n=1 Tax=Acorus gramineus TaxID=55184 RepID=A0AAV9BI27_ACOGR|nr:Cytochrome P450 71D8 [Acorus gramineus]
MLTGAHARIERSHRDIDKFFEGELDAHVQCVGLENDQHDDFVSALFRLREDPSLDVPLTRDDIKALLMIIASFIGLGPYLSPQTYLMHKVCE